ncbi:hypothetical protein AHiyo4_27320 [Arthrobacter sp. Hiyo4]|nr:hypothetical protein AHiyo4_27320 [Arthrobacter sp. Hiyo4]
MDNPEDRSTLIERKDFRGSFVAISGFVALLCWWIGISGFMTVGGFASGERGSSASCSFPSWPRSPLT